jgi:hypothetical protein
VISVPHHAASVLRYLHVGIWSWYSGLSSCSWMRESTEAMCENERCSGLGDASSYLVLAPRADVKVHE